MKDRNEMEITSKQLVFLLVGAMLGTGILTLARITAESVGQDAWIVVILGTLLPLVSIYFTGLLYKKYPDKDFIELVKYLTGKYIGTVIIIIFALYCLCAAAIVLRTFMEAVTAFLLPQTPLAVKLSLMLLACAYMAVNSIKILGRTYEFLFFILIPLLFLILSALIEQGSYLYLMPVLNNNMGNYIKGSLTTSFAYSGFELFLILCPFVVRRNEALKGALTGLLITILIYIFIVIATIMVFGPELVQKFVWPTLRLVATAEVPVLERLEFIFLMAWIGVAFRPIALQYFSSSFLLSKVFALKSHKSMVIVLFPIIIAGAMLSKNIYMTFKLSDYLGMVNIILGVSLPLFLYIISLFKSEKKVKKHAKA